MKDKRSYKEQQRAHELVDSARFQKDVRAIRRKWHITTPKKPTFDTGEPEWIVQNLELVDGLHNDIRLKFFHQGTYGLTAASFASLLRYIFYNEYSSFDAGGPMIVEHNDKKSGRATYEMTFYEQTTEQEIIKLFREFKQESIEPKKRPNGLPKRKHEKMRMAYLLKQKGLRPNEIVAKINEAFKCTDTYVEINRYIQEYKKRLPK